MTATAPLDNFGAGGVVTDRAVDRLAPAQLAAAENMTLPDGIPTERGGFSAVTAEDPIDTATALASVMAVKFNDSDDTEIIVTDALPSATLGKASDADNVGSVNGTELHARAFYGGEVLIPCSDGTRPITRWAGLQGGTTAGTGTYTIATGSTAVIGSTTNFDPHVPVGSYLGYRWRVVSRTSDTQAAIAAPADYGATSRATDPAPTGWIGLCVLVTDKGTISQAGSATTVTGKGTTWLSDGDGFTNPQAGDVILTKSDRTASPPVDSSIANIMFITAVGSDTSLTIAANSVATIADKPYVILRPCTGKEVCVHENAIFVAGVPWANDTVYQTPPGYDMGDLFNGRFGSTIQADEAMRMFETQVPAPGANGEVFCLLSTPWGLFVGRSNSVHVMNGQYPSNTVRKIADVGVGDQRAAVSVDDLALFAGSEGIWSWNGSSLLNLAGTDRNPGRLSEWKRKAKSMTRCVLGVVNGHLLVSFTSDDGDECWAIDLVAGVHLGNVTGKITKAVWMDSSRIAGEPDRLLFVTGQSDDLYVYDYAPAITAPGQTNEVTDENLGAMSLTTGTNVGGESGRLRTIVGLKMTYALSGSDPGEVAITTAGDGAALAAEATRDATTGTAPETTRIQPNAGAMGREFRAFQMKLARSGGTDVDRFAIHAIDARVRQRGPRA